MRMQINLGRLNALVTEPQRDHRCIDPCLQEPHRRRVPPLSLARHRRHSFATHRLTSWHREGADVQRLLPALSTYLGHGTVAATQVYISMTPDLLDEASRRFEHYVEHNLSPDAGQHRKGGTSHA